MSDLSSTGRTVRRIGHKGADHIAPGNTLASFDAALAHHVDMIEFDVLSENLDGTGELLLVHDFKHLAAHRDGVLTLEQGLAHFAQDAFADVELDVDLKLAGYEDRVIDALHRHGLASRALISTMEQDSLPRIRELDPGIRLGWSVPPRRFHVLARRHMLPAGLAMLPMLREWLPRVAAKRLHAGEIDAVMAHHRLVTPRFARAIAAAGGELYVWTVDDAALIARFERMPGFSGVITNDPRLFD
jgi:glycerophosphoryl diester phosphodiesterase